MSRISNTRLPASATEWPESASLHFDAFQPPAAYETGTAAGNKRKNVHVSTTRCVLTLTITLTLTLWRTLRADTETKR